MYKYLPNLLLALLSINLEVKFLRGKAMFITSLLFSVGPKLPRAPTSNERQLWFLHTTPLLLIFIPLLLSECEEVFYCGFDWHLSMAIRTCSLEMALFKSFALF